MMANVEWLRVHKMASIPDLIKDKVKNFFPYMKHQPFCRHLMMVCCGTVVDTLEHLFPALKSSAFLQSIDYTVKMVEKKQISGVFDDSFLLALEVELNNFELHPWG